MDAIKYRDMAIEKLLEIQTAHKRRTCSRDSMIQANAMGYAIAVLKKIPVEDGEEEKDPD